MKRWERWSLILSGFCVSASGLAYFWMKYLLTPTDPFSVINHPWQPAMLDLHLVASPLLVFLLGVILHSHIALKLRNGQRSGRRSGLWSVWIISPMILSGYLLQVASDPGLQQALLVIHLVSGTLFAISFAVHLGASIQVRRRGRNAGTNSRPAGSAAGAQPGCRPACPESEVGPNRLGKEQSARTVHDSVLAQ